MFENKSSLFHILFCCLTLIPDLNVPALLRGRTLIPDLNVPALLKGRTLTAKNGWERRGGREESGRNLKKEKIDKIWLETRVSPVHPLTFSWVVFI